MRVVILVFVVAAVACAVAHVAILASVMRRATASQDPSVPRPNLVSEVVWALIPMLVLALVLTATWVRVRENSVNSGVIMKIAQ